MTRTTNSKSIRNVVAGTASLVLAATGLAGCADRADEADLAAKGEQLSFYGVPGVYGDRATEGPETSILQRSMPFDPKYYAVVYLRFENGAHVLARHAYFPKTAGQNDNISCAIDYLKSLNSDSNCLPFDEKPGDGIEPVSENFENFRFGSQQRIYVYVDNDEVAFNEVEPISFTPFGAFDQPVAGGPETRDPNLSFYNAEARTIGGSSRKSLLYVENYYRGKNGEELPDTYNGADSTLYSMNFNLLMCKGGGKCNFADDEVIPLAIDPDTGNGWGSRP